MYTTNSGNFKINVIDKTDKILISNIGYFDLIVDIGNYIQNDSIYAFLLKPKTEQLEEVTITSKKTSYGWPQSLNSERESTQYFGFQFGTENCRLIKNPYNKRGKVVSIAVDLKKIKDHARQCRKCEVDYVSSFCIKFYGYDSIKNKPSMELYNKNIIINPENRNYKLKINIDSLKIPFPKNGICIGIETVNTKYIKPKKTFAIIAPFIKFTKTNETEKATSWVRHRDEIWDFKPLLNRDRKGKKMQYNSIIIDATIKIEN